MPKSLTNCKSVHRIWSDGSVELIALFQYSNDAKQFAKNYDGFHKTPYTLVVFDTCELSLTIVKKNEPAE